MPAIDAVVLSWLAACMLPDLRSRSVPALLTMPALGLAMLCRFALGGWVLVLLTIALIACSDLPRPSWRIPAGCLAGLLAMVVSEYPQQSAVCLALLTVWLLWESHLTGGADAQILLSLLLWCADPRLPLFILFAGGFQGLIGLFLKRKTIPFTVSILSGTLLWLLSSSG